MKFFPIRKLLLISLSSPFFYSMSHAETVPAGSASNASSSTVTTSVNQLPTIVVKATDDATENTGKYKKTDSSQATKMDLTLKETPQSVTVVTQQRMQDQGLNTIADVLHQVPGVSIGYNDSERPNYNIRGFGVDNIQIDGISSSYTGISGSVLALPVFDTAIYDHVEVLKGVNGLNTGLGEPSASINMIHKRPTQEFKAAASVSYDTFDGRRYTGDISGGLLENDKLNARLIASYSEGGTGKDYYDKDSKLISGSITSKLTDQTALTLGIDYQDDNPKGLGGGVPVFYSDGSKAHFSSEDNFGAMNWVQWHRQLQNTYIYLDHQFNENWKAKVAFSRQDLDAFAKTSYAYNGNLNKDGSGLVYSHWADEGELSQNTFDVTVNGLFSLFNREHQVVFGFNGWDRDTKTYGLTYPAYSTNNTILDIRDFYGDASPDFNPQRTGVNTETHTKQNGVFLNTRWSVMDGLRVFTGGRLSDWKTDTQQQTGIFIPYVAATYDVTPQSTVYTSYTEIFKPQTNRDINDQFLDPVTGSNIEVGIKNSFFDQNLDVNLAAFYTKKDNVAEQVEGTGVNGIDAKYRAVKGASTKGVELEALGQLTEKLNLSFGYGYNQTEDADGETINTANPKQTAKLHLNYKMDDILAGLRVGGGVNWYGSSYDYINMGSRAAPNLIKAEQEDYFVANLFGSYEINPQASVSLNINNLFDKQYYTRIISSYKTGYMGDGRSAAVTLRFKY